MREEKEFLKSTCTTRRTKEEGEEQQGQENKNSNNNDSSINKAEKSFFDSFFFDNFRNSLMYLSFGIFFLPSS
jgi:hypothetical protein